MLGSGNHRLARLVGGLVVLLLIGAFSLPVSGASDSGELRKADGLYDQQNFKEASQVYRKFLESKHPSEELSHASFRLITSQLRLQDYDGAIQAAGEATERFKGTLKEIAVRRLLATMYLTMPHHGTEKGGKFHRGRWDQGIRKDSTISDKRLAVENLQQARDLLIRFQSDPGLREGLTQQELDSLEQERIATQFELVAALTRFSPYDQNWHQGWGWWGGEEHDPNDDTVGEEAEAIEGLGGRGFPGHWGGGSRIRPRGIPVSEAGKPLFDPLPPAWSTELPMGQQVKFLLREIETLDTSKNKEQAAQAVYRRAMLARTRYGPHRLNTYMYYWDGGRQPYKDSVEKARLEELADSEVLTLVGTRIARVTLPPDEDILGLLRRVIREFPDSSFAAEAQYAVGLYYQSRRQYREAIREYRRLIREHRDSSRAGSAQNQITRIGASEVVLQQTGVQLAGDPAAVPVRYRNTDKIRVKIWQLDLQAYIRHYMRRISKDEENATSGFNLHNLGYALLRNQGQNGFPYLKYRRKKVADFQATVSNSGDYRYENREIKTPITEQGCYVVEATCRGAIQETRSLLLLSDLALVEKKFKDQQLYFTVDARTGRPVAGAALLHFQYWTRYKKNRSTSRQRAHFEAEPRKTVTDENGISLFKATRKTEGWPQVLTLARSPSGSFAFTGAQYWSSHYNPSREWQGRRSAIFTDRPVYRPDQTVKFKAWVRDYAKGEYRPASNRRVQIEIRDPQSNMVYQKALDPTETGAVSDQFRIKKGAPLGLYSILVDGNWTNGNQFRVEEYKKPEFEVSVETKSDLVRLGETVDGTIQAKYYFGAPVSKGRVTYKIFREDYDHRYVRPGYWDWLYGSGYGVVWYPCEWLPWWDRHGPKRHVWYPWWGTPPKPQRELVAEGTGQIGEDGTLSFQVDTSAAAKDHPDRDHLYSIEAEVVDASRRTITGSGQIKVTRQEFYAFLDVDRGYYEPGDQIFVNVKALTANDTPVASQGKLKVAAIRYRSEGNTAVVEEPLESRDASTDGQGTVAITLKAGRSGQYKISYETEDSQGRPVIGARVIWVRGADFKGTSYRFNDLEILTDRRTYEPGDTARLMINTSRPGATILFSHHMDQGVLTNYKVVTLEEKSTIIEMPVTAKDVPNFFVEATVVVEGKTRQEARELLVPPKDHVMNVEIEPSQAEYRPGEDGVLKIRARTPDGKPVQAELALSVFDRSVLYIQPELAPDVRTTFWGQKRSHGFQMTSNLNRTFQAVGYAQDPLQFIQSDPARDWYGSWGHHWANFASGDLESKEGVFGGVGGAMVMSKSSSRMMVADESAPMAQGMAAPPPSAPGEMGRSRNAMKSSREEADGDFADGGGGGGGAGGGDGEPAYKAARVRSEFDDTAYWNPTIITDSKGEAELRFSFPENLTTWKIRALGMDSRVRVGDGSASVVTTKKFVLRLQAPRFFVERDRLTLSANLHNYLEKEKKAKVSLQIPEDLMEILSPPVTEVRIPAGGEVRVDWEVKVNKEGFAVIKMIGLTDQESDAVQMGFPVLVHGIEKTVSKTGLIRPSAHPAAEIILDVPAERRPEASRLEVRFSPSLAGAMIEAVPYLLDYPYGCTEQTMSRFLPAVLVQRSLMSMGVSLEEVARTRTNLNSQEIGGPQDRYQKKRPLGETPIFSQEILEDIVKKGLARLASFQLSGGGWGWWANDRVSTHLTAYVVWGLTLAMENDVDVDPGMLDRGFQSLESSVATDVTDWKDSGGAGNSQAYLAYVLSLRKRQVQDLTELLYERRLQLSLYGKALLSLTLRNLGDSKRADIVLRNVRQYEKRDEENQTTYYDLPQDGWWFWWNNDVETHAWILQAILAKDPKDPANPGLVKWLLNNRKNGTYWRSTRDTALSVAALIDFMRATREVSPDYTLKVFLDGELKKSVRVTGENMLSFDNKLTLTGDALTSGRHVLRIEKEGRGAVYFSSYLTYFTKEEGIEAAGLEVKVDRTYYKLVRSDRTATVKGSRLQEVRERHLRYERILLADGDRLESSDQIEVELRVTAKNDYEYLVFEDFKPAGCEPVDLKSGSRFGELCSNMELRDEKVAFFITNLTQGEHLIKYRLRAEIPGTFHALPTRGWAMYAPEIRANADEAVIRIVDR